MSDTAWFGSDAEAMVDGVMHAAGLEGLTLAIAKDDEAVVKGFGFADIENDVPAGPETVYRIGSLTKQFTAAAVMLLTEREALRLDDTLERLLPETPERGYGITVEHLLTHTSGIRNYTEIPAFAERSRLHSTHEQIARLFAAEPLDFAPGDQYRYSNSGYYLLGVIIERASGMPYHDFMNREVFAPLGLEQTFYLDNYRIIKRRAQGYDRFGEVPIRADQISMTAPFAAGALGSTGPDLLKWQAALTGTRLIRAETYERMTTPGTLNDGSRTTYGYGVMIGSLEGHRKWSHAGTINGFRALLAHYPDDRLTIALLFNNGRAPCEAIESRLARHVLGIPAPEVPEVEVSNAELERVVGTYRQGPATVRLVRSGDTLRLDGADLRPVGEGRFLIAADPETSVKVEGDTLVVEREGQRTAARRVEPEA